MRIPSGKTDAKVFFKAVDETDLLTPLTGLSSFTVYRSRNGGALTAYTTPTVTELDNTNAPGWYALTLDEDTTLTGGAGSEEYFFRITATGMAPVGRSVEIYEATGGDAPTAEEVAAAVWAESVRTLTAIDEDSTTLDLDATIRAAVGLASANLDTQLGAIDDFIDTEVSAIKGVTDKLDDTLEDAGGGNWIFTVAALANAPSSGGGGATAEEIWEYATRTLTAIDEDSTTLDLDATIRAAVGLASANLDTQIGDLPTNAELATALAAADDAVLAAIAGLNNITAASVWAVATRTLTALDEDTTTLDLDATIRAAVGLASANLDTQLDALPTAAEVTSAVWAAGARTLTALDEDSTTLDLDATIRAALGMASANFDTQIGDLPTNAELATALASADDAVLAAIAALNNVSTAGVATAVWAAGTRTLTAPTNLGILDAAATRAALGLASANLDTQLAALPTAAENAAAYLAEEVESGMTVLQSMRGFAAILMGPWTNVANVYTWRNPANTEDRVVATVGATSRGAPTLTLD